MEKEILKRMVALSVALAVIPCGMASATIEEGSATGENAIAIGKDSVASGAQANAVGYLAKAEGRYANAIGVASQATKENATAIGNMAQATGSETNAIGGMAKASGANAVALGRNANAQGENSVALGYGSVATEDNVVSIGNVGAERKLVNVAAGTADTDAVNVKQLTDTKTELNTKIDDNTAAIADNQTAINTNAGNIAANSTAIAGLDQRVTSLDGRLDEVGAGAAALAALHPLDYDPENKLSFAAGVGRYQGATAGAIGAFYRPNEDVMFSIGGTAGNGENMVNLGASFAIGKGSSGVARLSKVELVNKVQQMETKCEAVDAENKELRHEINNAKAENQKLQDRIAKLEAMVMKLAAK